MNHKLSIAGVLAGLLFSDSACAQGVTPALLVDLEATASALGSTPTGGAVLPGVGCLFAADHQNLGRELWLLPEGGGAPFVLKDIHSGSRGSHPDEFVVFQGEAWFTASDGQNGRELWKSDGTAAGTVLAIDVISGQDGSVPSGLTVCGSQLFFTCFADGFGREPHCTQGNAASTVMLADIRPGIRGSVPGTGDSHPFTCCGTDVIFAADDGTIGSEPYVSDGSPAGTSLVVDLFPGPEDGMQPNEPAACNAGEVFFRGENPTSGVELFATDGTAANTRLVKDIRPGGGSGSPTNLISFNGKLFFTAFEATFGRELYSSDGTTVGTDIVTDIRTGAGSSNPHDLVVCNNKLIFGASRSPEFDEPWCSDGTAAGTDILADLNPGTFSSFLRETVCCDNLVFFRGRTQATGEELFVTDGTPAGTGLVVDIVAGPDFSSPNNLFCCGSHVAFTANGPAGAELYVSDGTANGTVLHDLVPLVGTGGSEPDSIRPIDANAFFFRATTAAHGEEVFFFDGTTAHPVEVNPGPADSNPDNLTVVGRTLYFTATENTTGTELWRSVEGGPPQLVADIRAGFLSSFPTELTAFDHQTLACRANTGTVGTEFLVAQNGVPGVQVFDIRPGASSSLAANLARLIDQESGENRILFSANDGTHGTELFVFDGSTAELFADLEVGSIGSSPRKFAVEDDELSLLLIATVGGTTRLLEIAFGVTTDGPTPGEIEQLLASSGEVDSFVTANREQLPPFLVGKEFGAQDGIEPQRINSSGQMETIADVNEGPADSHMDAANAGFVGSAWVTSGESADDGNELRAVETAQVATVDILSGSASSRPTDIVQFGNGILFAASGKVANEREQYTYTSSGVTFLFDGNLRAPQVVGVNVVGGLFRQAVGSELVRFPMPGAVSTRVGTPCNGKHYLFTSAPVIGKDVNCRAIGGGANDIGVVAFSAPLNQPLDLFGCKLHINPTNALAPIVGAGKVVQGSFQVPNDTSLIGGVFGTQSVWIESGGSVLVGQANVSRIGDDV